MYSPDNRSPLCTDLVVGEEAPGAAVGAGISRACGSGSHSGVCGVGQGEGPSVRRQPNQRLGPHRAAVDPVLGHLRLGRESQQSVGSTHVTPHLLYHWRELPQVSFLSRQTRRDKRRVGTRGSSRQRYFCHLPPHSARTGYATVGAPTPYLRASVHLCCQRPPKGLGSNNYDCGSNIASK